MTRALALALTLPTGFAALVYEVAWQRWLATLLGSHSEATAAVLALFLGGLSLGYALFGRIARARVERAALAGRAPRLLALYGAVEAAIGVLAFAFPALFAAVQAVSVRVPLAGDGAGFAVDLALSALLVLPPAVLMGATIPVLTQALARDLSDATRFHALVYALNTAGAFAGALAAAFWLIPAFGLAGAVRGVGVVNLLAGLVYALLDLRARRLPALPGAERGAPQSSELHLLSAAALLLGLGMMTLQTVLNRVGALAFGSSQFTFALVVAVFVLCIALGSLAVAALGRAPRGGLLACAWGLVASVALLYRPLENAPYWAHVLRTFFRDHAEAFWPYHVASLAAMLGVLAVPIALSGALLPLFFHALRRSSGDLGDVAGRLYSLNTVGSLLGAVVGGYALFFWLDLAQIYRVALGALGIAALLGSFAVAPRRWRLASLGLAVPLVLVLASLGPWRPDRLAVGLFRQREPLPTSYAGPDAFFAARRDVAQVLRYEDDPTASIAVVSIGGSLALLTNGKNDSTLVGDYPTTALLGLVPALFAERAERAFVIGYGTGVTAGELAALESTREVVVAEISRGVLHSAPLFDFGNLGASKHPEVRIVRGDAYRTLLRSDGRFDVIASEPSNPWVTGVEMLYSREFLEAARERLAPGGVFSQWVQLYDSDPETLALVLRTYASVFDHVAVWYTLGIDLLLLGFDDPTLALDVERLQARAARPDFAAGLARAGVASFPALLAHELLPLGVVRKGEEGPVHSVLHPILADHAARAFFRGGVATLPVFADAESAGIGARHSLFAGFVQAGGGASPAALEAAAAEVCDERPRECVAWLARLRTSAPDAARLAERLEQAAAAARLPESVDPDLLYWVSRGNGSTEPPPLLGPTAARGQTRLFEAFFAHAAPFSRRDLARIWDICAADPRTATACGAGRVDAEARLGSLP